MKFSFMVSLVGWIALFVVVALLYYALRTFGVFHYIEDTVRVTTSGKGQAGAPTRPAGSRPRRCSATPCSPAPSTWS